MASRHRRLAYGSDRSLTGPLSFSESDDGYGGGDPSNQSVERFANRGNTIRSGSESDYSRRPRRGYDSGAPSRAIAPPPAPFAHSARRLGTPSTTNSSSRYRSHLALSHGPSAPLGRIPSPAECSDGGSSRRDLVAYRVTREVETPRMGQRRRRDILDALNNEDFLEATAGDVEYFESGLEEADDYLEALEWRRASGGYPQDQGSEFELTRARQAALEGSERMWGGEESAAWPEEYRDPAAVLGVTGDELVPRPYHERSERHSGLSRRSDPRLQLVYPEVQENAWSMTDAPAYRSQLHATRPSTDALETPLSRTFDGRFIVTYGPNGELAVVDTWASRSNTSETRVRSTVGASGYLLSDPLTDGQGTQGGYELIRRERRGRRRGDRHRGDWVDDAWPGSGPVHRDEYGLPRSDYY